MHFFRYAQSNGFPTRSGSHLRYDDGQLLLEFLQLLLFCPYFSNPFSIQLFPFAGVLQIPSCCRICKINCLPLQCAFNGGPKWRRDTRFLASFGASAAGFKRWEEVWNWKKQCQPRERVFRGTVPGNKLMLDLLNLWVRSVEKVGEGHKTFSPHYKLISVCHWNFHLLRSSQRGEGRCFRLAHPN